MKSKNSERFNHDPHAHDYDIDVKNELNPFRAGYSQLLNWVSNQANKNKSSVVLDLGIGTGNLSALIKADKIVGVDISKEMIAIAKEKLKSKTVEFIKSDFLEVFDQKLQLFDVAVSTYAIHHLETYERAELFGLIYDHLKKNGRAIFGDLMFKDNTSMLKILEKYQNSGRSKLINEIKNEFFWDIEKDLLALESVGFTVQKRQFSELSWGIFAQK